MEQGNMGQGGMSGATMRGHYWMLVLNIAVSTAIMYVLMFGMIFSFAEFYNNFNMFYMALTMAMPMGIVMLVLMRSMYSDQRLNLILYGLFAAVLVLAFVAVRTQALVGDKQFLRSMIPHHSGAVLMCEQAKLSDPEIKQLCSGIIRSQTQEIDQMKTILKRL